MALRETLDHQPRLMVTPTMARLIHWVGIEAQDEEVANQGRELSRGIGGNFYAPRHRSRLLNLLRALEQLSPAKINPKSTLENHLGMLVNSFGWR